jgi:perosamine synthetase
MSQDGTFAQDIVTSLQQALGYPKKPVALHEPWFGGNEWAYVKECIDTGWVSSAGKFVDRFEGELRDTTGAAHVVAVVNGTAALHVCLMLAGVKRGDEVLMPSLSFVATANAVSYCGAVPHFVDVDEETLGISPERLAHYLEYIAIVREGQCINRKTGKVMRALVPMHTFGHPVRLREIDAVANQYKLVLIEDAAESLGSYYQGRHTGTTGRLSALSFNGNKIATTGGGGAVLIMDPELRKVAKHLTTTAKIPHRWRFDHDMVAYNYRLPNINAALGCAQLESLPGAVRRKRKLFSRYQSAFSSIKGLRLMQEPVGCISNYWLQTLILDESKAHLQDGILTATNDAGLMTRPAWTPMHHLPHFAECPRDELTVTESLCQRIINIPSSPQLLDEEA